MEGYQYYPRKVGKYDILPLIMTAILLVIPFLLFIDFLNLARGVLNDEPYINSLFWAARLSLIPGLMVIANNDLLTNELYISKYFLIFPSIEHFEVLNRSKK